MIVDVYIADNFYIILHDKKGKCYLLEISDFINLLRGHKVPLLEGEVEKIIEDDYLLGHKFKFWFVSDIDGLIITANTEKKKAVIEYSSHVDNIDEVIETPLLRIYTDLEVKNARGNNHCCM